MLIPITNYIPIHSDRELRAPKPLIGKITNSHPDYVIDASGTVRRKNPKEAGSQTVRRTVGALWHLRAQKHKFNHL